MSIRLSSPSATDGTVELADHLEVLALRSADRDASIEDLASVLRRGATTAEVGDPEAADYLGNKSGVVARTVASDAFAELHGRTTASDSAYPFTLKTNTLQADAKAEDSTYVFLLLLSQFGLSAGPRGSHPERLFELLSTYAAERYLGGASNGALAVHFGFPRDVLPKHFPKALEELCKKVGGMAPQLLARAEVQKDDRLDLVAWRDFPDRRRSKIILFGQCAVGKLDWRKKATELRPSGFCNRWLSARPSFSPLPVFFIPFALTDEDIHDISLDVEGLVLDRCRIAAMCREMPVAAKALCVKWSRSVLKSLRAS